MFTDEKHDHAARTVVIWCTQQVRNDSCWSHVTVYRKTKNRKLHQNREERNILRAIVLRILAGKNDVECGSKID